MKFSVFWLISDEYGVNRQIKKYLQNTVLRAAYSI